MGKVTTAAIMAAEVTAVIKKNNTTGAVSTAPVFCDHITEKLALSGYTKENKR